MTKKKLLLFLMLFLLFTFAGSHAVQTSLSKKVLRLHILANSNSVFDQEIKLKVRDEVVNYISPLIKESKDISETKEIILKNMEQIRNKAQETVSLYSNDTVTLSLAKSNFPTKKYESFAFPAGNYESLKIAIGAGKGNNWWCVMFPPLCFTNSSAGSFDDSSVKILKDNLSPEEYELISSPEKPEIKVKFRILEWLSQNKQ